MGCRSGKVVMGLVAILNDCITGSLTNDDALISLIAFVDMSMTLSERPMLSSAGSAVNLFLFRYNFHRVLDGPVTSGRNDSRFSDIINIFRKRVIQYFNMQEVLLIQKLLG